jgi:hypothetical protein
VLRIYRRNNIERVSLGLCKQSLTNVRIWVREDGREEAGSAAQCGRWGKCFRAPLKVKRVVLGGNYLMEAILGRECFFRIWIREAALMMGEGYEERYDLALPHRNHVVLHPARKAVRTGIKKLRYRSDLPIV